MIMPDLPDYVKDSTFMDITMQGDEKISGRAFFFHGAAFSRHFLELFLLVVRIAIESITVKSYILKKIGV